MAAVAPTGISIFSGVNVQALWSGRPEQEMVTNIGAVSEAALMGVTETVAEPDCPCLSESVAGATDTEKSGVEPATACTGVTSELEPRCAGSPV